MNTNPYLRLYKRCLTASVWCYFFSFFFPVYRTNGNDLDFMQGIFMLLVGWLSLWTILFFAWVANPIYITLILREKRHYGIKKPTLRARIFAYLSVLFGTTFPLYGKIIIDEGGCWHEITNLLPGYWLWESAMVLLAIALMAKSEEGSLAHRIVTYYIAQKSKLSPLMKYTIAIIFGLMVLCFFIISFSPSQPN